MKRALAWIASIVAVGIACGGPASGITGMPMVPIPAPTGEPLAVEGKRFVTEWTRALRDSSARYDADALVADALAAAQPGESRQVFFDRIAIAIGGMYWSFAPLDAVHDGTTRYRLPFPLDEPRFVSQGVDGAFSHEREQRHSFDFAMPVGATVLAAREGVVSRVRDRSTSGGLDRKYGGQENDVLVLHTDGTFAAYVHLQAGIAVKEGQRVAQGDVIGRSGNTGYTAGPHLHFAVLRRTGAATFETVPIRFGVGSPLGFVPEERQFYGGKPKKTVDLVVTAKGAPLGENTPLTIAPGARSALTVTMTAAGAAPIDVTADAATSYFSPTGWSLVVDGRGQVTGSPTADYAAALARLDPDMKPPGSTDWGVVVVRYADAGANRFGFLSFPVLIRDAPPR